MFCKATLVANTRKVAQEVYERLRVMECNVDYDCAITLHVVIEKDRLEAIVKDYGHVLQILDLVDLGGDGTS